MEAGSTIRLFNHFEKNTSYRMAQKRQRLHFCIKTGRLRNKALPVIILR
ncbi:hypothetical protein D068_cds29070 [Bacillus atrophaeus UCMB-5137]|nr:hypothetical protein D068_cds29070 [Bacillus atrophaeus UCMB-5137]